jgi:osmoprotectant transport system permease protein
MIAMVLSLSLSYAIAAAPDVNVRVGSKAFTEGVVLGEIAAALIERADAGAQVQHKQQIGGTRLVFTALEHGDIDVYAEYTGTLHEELLPGVTDEEAVTSALASRGLAITKPLGFNNTYGLAMREDTAARLGIRTISELARHAGTLTFGVSNEFLDRKDGWPSLSQAYGLAPKDLRGLDHDVSYQAVASGAVAVIDCYTTDAEIAHHGLRVLVDDRAHFPRYDAIFLYRTSLDARVVHALDEMAGRISEAEIARLNANVRIDKRSERDVARAFVSAKLGGAAQKSEVEETRFARIRRRTLEHLALVGAALALSIVIALPIGIVVARRRRVGQAVLAVVGVVQTIPSIALLVLFVPLLGIGSVPAVVAMVLYGLLPIVSATYTGLTTIAPSLRESALALGLTSRARLLAIELPLASPSILSGIQTSAVIGVGTATIGALVGAGGYGQSILTGVRLADTALILEGALPAALLAMAIQGAFVVARRWLIPRGLRL